MEIKQAIEHARKVAEEKYTEGMLCHANPDDGKLNECIECAKQHEQLADWLEELQGYKDLEERLQFVYGECGGLLEKVVEHLERHEGIDLPDSIFKARLLTDEDVDKWEMYQSLEKQGKLLTGWIPLEERLPEDDKYILVSFENFSVADIARYEEDEDGGTFYPGDEDKSYASDGLFVNAWMPLPEPYRPEE